MVVNSYLSGKRLDGFQIKIHSQPTAGLISLASRTSVVSFINPLRNDVIIVIFLCFVWKSINMANVIKVILSYIGVQNRSYQGHMNAKTG